jgi:glucosamine 6-phosphate synthetase-like amidotransferase/phosphosugar isomerase protein
MCGIAGFIGLSKKPKATYEIMTNLFDFLEFRGTDASGIWATEAGKNGKVYYHKEPIKSSQFVQKDFWKKTRRSKLNLLLAHARSTSKGGGHASNNGNNHPFVSLDKRIGMVHNGTIEEATFLSKKYQCISETDSEVILRIFEKGMEDKLELDDIPERISHRLGGIKDVWATITEGAMAVALGEREDDSQRNLFLFRNDQRPLWLADLRVGLGQVFFFSSPDIWYRAMGACSQGVKSVVKDQKLVEIPPDEVWVLHVDDENPYVSSQGQFYRFEMDVQKTGKDWAEEFFVVQSPKTQISVVTELDVDENPSDVPEKLEKPKQSQVKTQHWKDRNKPKVVDEYTDPYDLRYSQGGTEHEEICDAIISLVQNIKTTATNSCLEGTIPPQLYQDILESLESTKVDLQGTLRLSGE